MPLSLIETLDDMVKADLLSWRDMWFHCLLWSTAAVALGLVFEGPELWLEIKHIGSTSHTIPPKWKILAFVGWLLIVLGVAGEGIFEAMVSRADGQVQTFNDTLLTAAQREAGAAKHSAESAAEAARLAKADSAKAVTEASNALTLAGGARKEADTFGKEIVSAKQLAAEAESHLADALQRVAELQERINPRRISDKEKNRAWSILITNPKGSVNVSCLNTDKESCDFATEIAELLKSAGWSVTGPSGVLSFSAAGGPPVGLTISVRENTLPPRATILKNALEKIGFSVLGEFRLETPKDEVHLLVGAKP